ncbi:Uncharacterised protein [Mycobacteroides abscessus subsp. abscessus]|nr:Uncharacterised protein [Mycobacteroides abscessus subsp. abscessus]
MREHLLGGQALVVEWAAAGQQLPEQQSEGVDVGARADLGRGVSGFPDRACGRLGIVSRAPAQDGEFFRGAVAQGRAGVDAGGVGGEVGELRHALGGEHHVGRLDGAVQGAVAGGVVQRGGQAAADPGDRLRPAESGQPRADRRIRRRDLAFRLHRGVDRP